MIFKVLTFFSVICCDKQKDVGLGIEFTNTSYIDKFIYNGVFSSSNYQTKAVKLAITPEFKIKEIKEKDNIHNGVLFNILDLFEDKDYLFTSCGCLKRNEITEEDKKEITYSLCDFTTPVSRSDLVSLYFSKVKPKNNFANVCIGARPYFSVEQMKELGNGFLNGNIQIHKASVYPEACCITAELARRYNNSDSQFFLIISTVGFKTVFSFYEASNESKKDKIKVKNYFHIDFDGFSDELISRYTYSKCEEYVKNIVSTTEISEERKNITMYPRSNNEATTDYSLDLSSVWAEVHDSLNNSILSTMKVPELIAYYNEPMLHNDNVKVYTDKISKNYSVSSNILNVKEIKNTISDKVSEIKEDCCKKVKEVVEKIKEVTDKDYNVYLKSDHYTFINSNYSYLFEFDELQKSDESGNFEKKKLNHIKNDVVVTGAALIANKKVEIVEERKWEGIMSYSNNFHKLLNEIEDRSAFFINKKEINDPETEKEFIDCQIFAFKGLQNRFNGVIKPEEYLTLGKEWNDLKIKKYIIISNKEKRDVALKYFSMELSKLEAISKSKIDKEIWSFLKMDEKLKQEKSIYDSMKENYEILVQDIENEEINVKKALHMYNNEVARKKAEEEEAKKKKEEANKESEVKKEDVEANKEDDGVTKESEVKKELLDDGVTKESEVKKEDVEANKEDDGVTKESEVKEEDDGVTKESEVKEEVPRTEL